MARREARLAVVTTSWDDGHPLDLRIAHLLAIYGLTGTFYVSRKASWPIMNSLEIRELSSKFEIGGHLIEHRSLDQLPDEQALEQLSGSRDWIEEVTGKPCRTLCFPGGKYRRDQLSLVEKAGYLAARTTELLSTAFPRRVNGVALLPPRCKPTRTRGSPMPGMPSSGGPWQTCFAREPCSAGTIGLNSPETCLSELSAKGVFFTSGDIPGRLSKNSNGIG